MIDAEFLVYEPQHAMNILSQSAIGVSGVDVAQSELFAKMKLNGPAFTVFFDERIVACAGIERMWTGVGQAWALLVHGIGNLPMNPQANRAKFAEIAKEFRRVQAPIKPDFTEGISFAKYMGFKQESVMKKYFPDGSDALMFVLEI